MVGIPKRRTRIHGILTSRPTRKPPSPQIPQDLVPLYNSLIELGQSTCSDLAVRAGIAVSAAVSAVLELVKLELAAVVGQRVIGITSWGREALDLLYRAIVYGQHARPQYRFPDNEQWLKLED